MESKLQNLNTYSKSNLTINKRIKNVVKILFITLRYLVLILLVIPFLLPYIYMIFSAFKPQAEIFQYAFPLSWKTFIPQTWTVDNFSKLMQLSPYPFTRYLGNSIYVALACTLGSLVINSTAAYAFAKLRFPMKNLIFGIFLITMMVPFEALAIPLYLIVRDFGWVNTFNALIIPWIANAAGIFLLRQYFIEIPSELIDAARIDGCNHLSAFCKIIIPNSIPALITFSLIRFQASWDAFFWPLIAAPSPERRVVQVAISTFATEVETRWGLTFAASVIGTLPILLIFLFLQRYYVRGVVMSGLKG